MYLEYKVIDNKYTNINQILKQEFKLSAKLMHKVISNNRYTYITCQWRYHKS